jgi:hypothetical protein
MATCFGKNQQHDPWTVQEKPSKTSNISEYERKREKKRRRKEEPIAKCNIFLPKTLCTST